MKCYWWNKWYHRRLRNIDVIILLPSIQLAALKRIDHNLPQDEFYKLLHDKIDNAFELYKLLPGSEHWQCECSKGLMFKDVELILKESQ